MSKDSPTTEDLVLLGLEIDKVLQPLRARYPGLEYAVTYGVPRTRTGALATAMVSTIDDLKKLLVFVVNGAKEVHAQAEGKGLRVDPIRVN